MSEKHYKSELITQTIKIGRRGQITLPKTLRMVENLKRGDKLKLVRQPTGAIYLSKVPKENPISKKVSWLPIIIVAGLGYLWWKNRTQL